MKIVSWNCNGALRKKFKQLDALEADIYVVQECENPALVSDNEYKNWSSNYLWIGSNKNKGLGIFCRNDICIEKLELDSDGLEYILPCLVNSEYMIWAVWTKEANSPTFKYIGQFWKYLQLHKSALCNYKDIVIGDFNSNACWDAWDRWWNHSDVVRELAELDIVSLYHVSNDELQGKESKSTFYMGRNLSRAYHIDYAFVAKALIPKATIEIGDNVFWLNYSDHVPLIISV